MFCTWPSFSITVQEDGQVHVQTNCNVLILALMKCDTGITFVHLSRSYHITSTEDVITCKQLDRNKTVYSTEKACFAYFPHSIISYKLKPKL